MSKLLLAPMEGLADDVLRKVLTRIGGYDQAVTEFIWVSGSLLPNRTFTRISPELLGGGKIPSDMPVVVQAICPAASMVPARRPAGNSIPATTSARAPVPGMDCRR